MDACIPENPTTQCHRCLRQRPTNGVQSVKRDGRISPPVVIDASTVLVDGRCQFRVDSESLGQAELGADARPFLREKSVA